MNIKKLVSAIKKADRILISRLEDNKLFITNEHFAVIIPEYEIKEKLIELGHMDFNGMIKNECNNTLCKDLLSRDGNEASITDLYYKDFRLFTVKNKIVAYDKKYLELFKDYKNYEIVDSDYPPNLKILDDDYKYVGIILPVRINNGGLAKLIERLQGKEIF